MILQNAVTGEIRAVRHNRMGGGQWHKLSRGLQSEEKDMPKKVLDDAEEIVKDLKKYSVASVTPSQRCGVGRNQVDLIHNS